VEITPHGGERGLFMQRGGESDGERLAPATHSHVLQD
jgi:hypothetical protein